MQGRYPGHILYFKHRGTPAGLSVSRHKCDAMYSHVVLFLNRENNANETEGVGVIEIDGEESERTAHELRKSLIDGGAAVDRFSAASAYDVDIFRRTGWEFRTARSGISPVNGLLAIESVCGDPAKEKQFNRWYNEVHVPDMLGTGLYHTAYRYEIASRRKNRGHFLALYETDNNPKTAHEMFLTKFRPDWIRSGRVIDTMRLLAATSYEAL